MEKTENLENGRPRMIWIVLICLSYAIFSLFPIGMPIFLEDPSAYTVGYLTSPFALVAVIYLFLWVISKHRKKSLTRKTHFYVSLFFAYCSMTIMAGYPKYRDSALEEFEKAATAEQKRFSEEYRSILRKEAGIDWARGEHISAVLSHTDAQKYLAKLNQVKALLSEEITVFDQSRARSVLLSQHYYNDIDGPLGGAKSQLAFMSGYESSREKYVDVLLNKISLADLLRRYVTFVEGNRGRARIVDGEVLFDRVEDSAQRDELERDIAISRSELLKRFDAVAERSPKLIN